MNRGLVDGALTGAGKLVLVLLTGASLVGCAMPGAGQSASSQPTAAPGPRLEIFGDILGRQRSPTPDQTSISPVVQRASSADAEKQEKDRAVIYDGENVSRAPIIDQTGHAEQNHEPRLIPAALNVADNGISPADGDKFQVVFDNADINSVARAILGDGLKANYIVDPRVRGTVTLSAQRPVSRSQLLLMLESALRSAGAVLVHHEGVYRILPGTDANSVGGANIGPYTGAPGFGITALPLQNISADTLSKILNGFGASPDSVKVDQGRNLLIVRGTTSERQWLIDTALAFDTDWMRNQSVGIFPIRNSSPEVVIKEIDQLAPESSLIKLQPISRLNAILVVAKSPEMVRQVQTWINRLDRRSDYGPGVHVYRLKSADARKVVTVLKEVFVSSSSSAVSESVSSGPTPIARLPGGGIPPVPVEATKQGERSPEKTNEGGNGAGAGGSSAPKIRITADPATNAVVVYATQDEYKPIERAIVELDRQTPEVAIEAIAAQVTLNDTLNYGVQFFLNGAFKNASGNAIPVQGGLSTSIPLAAAVPGANLVVGSLANPQVVLSALRDVTDVKILSSPSLVVANNQAALLQVGDQVPVTTGTATSVVTTQSAIVNSVSYVDTGIILRVTPHITRNNEVQLDIEQEVSAVQQNANANTLTPTISQQKVKSTIAVASGQTILLAGLISQNRSQEKTGIPGVIDIPFLGNALSNAANKGVRTELIVFVQLHVVRNHFDAQRVAEDLKSRMAGFGNW